MKKTKIVIPALAVLLLSTAASVSGTVAWFSMSTSVTVTGMSVTTKVSSNLQIAETNAEDNFSDSIDQEREGIIEPASSINGVGFYWTTNGKNDGDAKTDEYTSYAEDTSLDNLPAGKTQYDDDFNTAYQFTAADTSNVSYGYIDYSFYLKGAASVENQKIVMTKCNMLYNGLAIDTSFAWRVGMFVYETQKDTTVADGTVIDANNLVTILDFESSKNQNEKNRAVQLAADVDLDAANPKYYTNADCADNHIATGTSTAGTYYLKGDAAPKAVTSASALADVSHPNANAVVHPFSQLNTVKYFKVVVRLWLEGEDISCTSTTYANLTRSWTLDLEFKLGKGVDENDHSFDGVTNIGSAVPQNNG